MFTEESTIKLIGRSISRVTIFFLFKWRVPYSFGSAVK